VPTPKATAQDYDVGQSAAVQVLRRDPQPLDRCFQNNINQLHLFSLSECAQGIRLAHVQPKAWAPIEGFNEQN
jgi:hypothetical protein